MERNMWNGAVLWFLFSAIYPCFFPVAFLSFLLLFVAFVVCPPPAVCRSACRCRRAATPLQSSHTAGVRGHGAAGE